MGGGDGICSYSERRGWKKGVQSGEKGRELFYDMGLFEIELEEGFVSGVAEVEKDFCEITYKSVQGPGRPVEWFENC